MLSIKKVTKIAMVKLHTNLNAVLSSIFLLSTFIYNAQVVEAQFEPEIVLDASSEPYEFDFNGDGIIEFVFLVQDLNGDTTIAGLPATYEGSGALLGVDNGRPVGGVSEETNAFDLFILNVGDEVTAAMDYGPDTSYALGIDLLINTGIIGILPYQYGAFLGQNGYLGADFMIGSETHYGWIKLSVSNDGSQITLHSYGYEATSNTSIVINGLSISEEAADGIVVNCSGHVVNINIDAMLLGSELTIHSLAGMQVHHAQLNETQTPVSLNNCESGIYIITIEGTQGVYSQKLYIH